MSSLSLIQVSVIIEHVKLVFLNRSIRDSSLLSKLLAFIVELLKATIFLLLAFLKSSVFRSAGTKFPPFLHSKSISLLSLGGRQLDPALLDEEPGVTWELRAGGTNDPAPVFCDVGADLLVSGSPRLVEAPDRPDGPELGDLKIWDSFNFRSLFLSSSRRTCSYVNFNHSSSLSCFSCRYIV